MFSKHKQHAVIDLHDGLKQLRGELYTQLERGKLKVEYTESVLLDIRQAVLTCDQMKNKLVNSINESFTKVMKAFKDRKGMLLAEIDKYFEIEREKIISHEANWKHKQQLTQELLRLNSSERAEAEILQQSKFIVDSIAKINEPIKFQEMKLINSLNDNITIPSAVIKFVEQATGKTEVPKSQGTDADDEEQKPKDVAITLHQLLSFTKEFMTVSEYKSIQYKA